MSMCDACIAASDARAAASANAQESARIELELAIARIVLTTTNQIDGYRVSETLEIVTAECALGINILQDMFIALSDAFGGRSVWGVTVFLPLCLG